MSDKSYDKKLADELADWVQNRDPITMLRNKLVKDYSDVQPELDDIDGEQDKIVAEAVEFALNSPQPGYEDLFKNVYVED